MTFAEIEKGLSCVQYAMKLNEDLLGIPQKDNMEYIAEAINALYHLNFRGLDDGKERAFFQLYRRVQVALGEGQVINHLWFKWGKYREVRNPSEQGDSTPKRLFGCSKCEEGWIVREIPIQLYKSGKERRAFPCECRQVK